MRDTGMTDSDPQQACHTAEQDTQAQSMQTSGGHGTCCSATPGLT